MFMFQAGSLIKELTIHANEIALTVERSVKNARKDADFIHLDAHKFETSPSVSIDCALMEKTNKAVVVPLDAGWSDIGSWSSLYDISQKDQLGNVIKGKVFTEDSINCYINSQSQTMVVIGVENLVIVNTPEGTLVISKDRAEEINRIVKKLKK